MSTLKTNTLSNVAGTLTVPTDTVVQGTAKAWVNFNGTGTVAIRAAFNVSSITDNGTGDYTVNFSTAMPDTNYGSSVTGGGTAGTGAAGALDASTARTVSLVRVFSLNNSGTLLTDAAQMCVAIFR